MSNAGNPAPAHTERDALLIVSRPHGFFSLVTQVLGQAHLAEQAGVAPVVYFNRHCPYWSAEGYDGASNVWEYFFEPLSDLSIHDLFPVSRDVLENATVEQFTEMSHGTRVTVTDKYPDVVEYWSPLGIDPERGFVHGLMEKYLVLKPGIRAKVEDFQRSHFGSGPIIGVHYRGVEKAHGAVQDGVAVQRSSELAQAFLREMRAQLERTPEARFYVATDSASFLEEARATFTSAIICREAIRLDRESEAVGLHFSGAVRDNGARLAEEVLLDMLLLARTSLLIHGISNVSNVALYYNPQLPHVDIEVKTSRGMVYQRREFYRRLEKRLPGLVHLAKRLLGR
jgi:hypothetical protein